MSDNEEIEAYLPLDYPCVSGIIANVKDTIVGVIFGSAVYECRVAIDIEV